MRNEEEKKIRKKSQIIDIKPNSSLNDIIVENKKKDNGKTIIHIVENYLNEFYNFRYNVISLDIEVQKKEDSKWLPINENSLWIELKKEGINIPIQSFLALLKSDFVKKFNPLKQYFLDLNEWDGKVDFIAQYANYVVLENEADREQFNSTFKKWVVRAVKCTLEPFYFNKQAFIISDDGNAQNIGKSSWCRFLCPSELSNYIAEDISKDKDARILLCKNFLINLDELAVLSKTEINHLKAFFSKEQVNERIPYDRKNSIIPRVASFIGSTNMSTFLQDETGSVRWIVFTVKDIDWSYRSKFNINNLWSQAYFLAYKDKTFNEVFTLEDVKENEKRNEKYTVMSPERELINKFFKIPKSNISSDVKFLTATEILIFIKANSSLQRLSNVGVGRGLKASGFKRVKVNGYYGYYVEIINTDFQNTFNTNYKT